MSDKSKLKPFSDPPASENEITSLWRREALIPEVSIICHAYNHAPFIRDALNGFLNQVTNFPFEIIIHDDASKDETARIIQDYSARFPTILRPIYQIENQYSQGRRPVNFTYERAQGKYIALCEGDDYWTDIKKLQRQYDVMEKADKIDLCVHPAYQYDLKTRLFDINFFHGKDEVFIPVESALESTNQFAATASYFFRKSALKNFPRWFFEAADLPFADYFIEALTGRNGVYYVPYCMSVYRRGVTGSYTQQFRSSGEEVFFIRLYSSIMKYTELLKEFEGIPSLSIDNRLRNVSQFYLSLAFKNRAYKLANTVVGGINPSSPMEFRIMKVFAKNPYWFALGASTYNKMRDLRHAFNSIIKKLKGHDANMDESVDPLMGSK